MALLKARPSVGVTAFGRLLRAHAALTRELNAQLIAEHGLTINDYEVLLLLARAHERKLRRVDLASEVVLSPSGITRLLDRLEKEGLVEKAACDSDARITYAVLTGKGLAKLRKVTPGHVASVERLLSQPFDEGELEKLADLLEKLSAGDDADCTEPAQ